MTLKHEKPNDALMAELLDVRAAAEQLDDVLRANASQIPNDYPQTPFKDMLLSLKALPDGTAAECRPVLHAADRRLAKIRH